LPAAPAAHYHAGVKRAAAFAPATVANVAVGFDVLGFELPVGGDVVEVERDDDAPGGVRIESVEGLDEALPLDAERNTAGVALRALIAGRGLSCGFRARVRKGIPLSAGMGGSAASAVAAVVAASALLDDPPRRAEQCAYAALGEASASGAAHVDNVAPCLWGGLTLVLGHDPPEIVALPVPAGIVCAFVHPHFRLETRKAREALARDLPLAVHARQAAYLGGFIAGCFRGDLGLVGRSLKDVAVEPQRAALIPGFAAVQAAALEAGALGASISGAGPSVFAWCPGEESAKRARAGMQAAFRAAGLESDGWVTPIGSGGAHLVGTE